MDIAKWASIANCSLGLPVNIFCLIVLTYHGSNSEAGLQFGLVISWLQSMVDILICLSHLAGHITSEPLSKELPEMMADLFCRVVKTFGLVWFLASLRTSLNVCLATFNVIKLLYPFMKLPLRLSLRIVIISILMVSNALAALVPHLFLSRFRSGEQRCEVHEPNEFITLHGK
ncbi:unnamed protein product [Protopolystoma xenopodis]|uniref:G-protein coupled receptors family 1 profile domain-containing protein n=1 Tax=Protopolystoma xenopodis TaxID=117903 RepID=A0A3S5CHU1_9PLAT|nr:unnamed protein product [Protopolystoma xenopodis]